MIWAARASSLFLPAAVVAGTVAPPVTAAGVATLEAWQAAAYEGKTIIREEGAAALAPRELKTALSYVVLPGPDGKKEVLLVRSVLPATGRDAFQPVADAGFFALGPQGQIEPVDQGPADLNQRVLDRRLPAEVVPDFAFPASGEVVREDSVRIGGKQTRLPFRVASVTAGDGGCVLTRRLEDGKAPLVDLDGAPYTVEDWREEWTFEPGRRLLTEVHRTVKTRGKKGVAEVVVVEESELVRKEARNIDEPGRVPVLAAVEELRALLRGFVAKKSARDLYEGISKLSAAEGAAAVPGLREALLTKLSYYRQESVPPRAAKGAPRPAPDFTLSALDGSSVSFPQAVKGKVALLVFWGHGCPPCRAEAPYLTKLAEKYGPRGFEVVAVNGYNEPKALIERFVAQQGLKHRILLMGGEVARQKYSVNSYPTSFWVDHEGNIVGRESGFSPVKVAAMEARIEKLLLAAKTKAEAAHERPAGGD